MGSNAVSSSGRSGKLMESYFYTVVMKGSATSVTSNVISLKIAYSGEVLCHLHPNQGLDQATEVDTKEEPEGSMDSVTIVEDAVTRNQSVVVWRQMPLSVPRVC